MTATFAARIPYNAPSLLGDRYSPATLTRPHSHRRPLLVVNDRKEGLGKVLRLDPTPDGLQVVVDLGARDARPIVADLNRDGGGYYVEPLVVRGQLLALRLSAVE